MIWKLVKEGDYCKKNLCVAGSPKCDKCPRNFGGKIEKEESFGDRDLCYEVKKQKRGRFLLLIIKANPAKLVELNRQFKLNPELLKCMFVKIDEEQLCQRRRLWQLI